MKYALIFLFLAPSVRAQQGITNVHEVAITTNTIVQSIALPGSVTDVRNATSSGTTSGAFAVEVYNAASSTATINCGFDVSLSSRIGSPWYGREIPAGVGIYFAVPTNRKLYCISQQTIGTNPVTITQFK